MFFIKVMLSFLVVTLLVYGFSGLSGKESIAFTFYGFGISAALAAFILLMVVLLVALCLFAFNSISVYPKLLFAEGFFWGMWQFAFNAIVPEGKSLTVGGVNIYNLGNYLICGMAVFVAIGILAVMFERSTIKIDKVKKNG